MENYAPAVYVDPASISDSEALPQIQSGGLYDQEEQVEVLKFHFLIKTKENLQGFRNI